MPSLRVDGHVYASVPLEDLGSYAAVVIVTDHRGVDYGRVVAEARQVVDTRNATRELRGRPEARGKVVTL